MTGRERKALLTSLRGPILEVPGCKDAWIVRGRKRKDGKESEPYLITLTDGEWKCSCPAGQDAIGCKHVGAVKRKLEHGEPTSFPEVDESKRPTYPQDNVLQRIVAQTMGQALVPVLHSLARARYPIGYLRDLQKGPGGPRCEMSDIITCICLRVLHHCSGDEAQGHVSRLLGDGLLHGRHMVQPRPPSEPAISLAMRRKDIYEAFVALVRDTNAPFEGLNELIALDGSEYSTPTLRDDRVTKSPSGQNNALYWLGLLSTWDKTLKLHAAVGATTGMFVACEITAGKTHDSKKAIALVEGARLVRFVKTIAADKAYVFDEFMDYLEQNGIKALVPAKSNSVQDETTPLGRHVITWNQNLDGEHAAYGKRELVEAQFSRDKRLNGDWLRSKTMEALAVELMAHVLVQNTRMLITKYIAGEQISLDFLDGRARAILDPARAAAQGRPKVDTSPKFRDGLEEAA
jgi:Transposase DDE domain/SWIM zinc finger